MNIADGVPRDQLILLNLGADLKEVAQRFASLTLSLRVGKDAAQTLAGQAAILSAVNSGRRTFLGGVYVNGDGLDSPIVTACTRENSLADAITELGGQLADAPFPLAAVTFGNTVHRAGDIQVCASDVTASIAPSGRPDRLQSDAHPAAAILATSLALGQMFRRYALDRRDAGHLAQSVQLFGADDITGTIIAKQLWVLGAGHLGQAFMWTLAACHRNLEDFKITVQDNQDADRANDSTSLLTSAHQLGRNKAVFSADWLREAGADASPRTDAFDQHTQVGTNHILISGLHDLTTRRLLEGAGASLVIDAGLGGREDNFTRFGIRTFPGRDKAQAVFLDTNETDQARHDRLVRSAAYEKLVTDDSTRCGLHALAETAVGVSFVGLGVSAFTIARLIEHGGHNVSYDKLVGDLRMQNVVIVRR